MPEYGDPQYWDKRYQAQKDKTFDWLQDYSALKFIIERICSKTSKILMLGCGNSILSEEMYKDGYQSIYNIDISEAVIQQMSERDKELTLMKYEVMDCTDLKYPDGFFDTVIDKSTIDALLCGSDPFLTTAKMTKEVQRVLKISGIYCAISYGEPDKRMNHYTMEHLSFEIEINEIAKEEVHSKNTTTHYIYICKKKADADEKCRENWEKVEKELILEEEEELQQKNQVFSQKYPFDTGIGLEKLAIKAGFYPDVHDDQENIEDQEEEEEDLKFLDKIKLEYLTNKEIEDFLGTVKEQMEKISTIPQ
jgi:ubiquinone/menaquinone biosynthesis C-methylase UbiE